MSANELDQYLKIDDDGDLTLADDTVPGVPFQDLFYAYNEGQPLIIENAKKESQANQVTVTGTASFMNVADLPVTAVFAVDNTGQTVATLRFSLIGQTPEPDSWRFSKSFRSLPVFPDTKSSLSDLHFLDTLALFNASFILTSSKDAKDEATGVPLAFGLNFVSQMIPKGAIGLLGTLAGADSQVTLYGPIITPAPTAVTPPLPARKYPWEAKWTVPGIQLQADMGIDFTITDSKLQFSDALLRIYCPLTEDWSAENDTYPPTTAVTFKMNVPSAAISADMTAKIRQNYKGLTLSGEFQGISLDNLSRLTDLANGDDLFNNLPDGLKQYGPALGGLSLEAAGISFVGSLLPSNVYITVGIPNLQMPICEGFTLKSIEADFVVSDPFASTRALTVMLEGEMDVVGASFTTSLEVPALVGRATLDEKTTVSLAKLFAMVSLPPPEDLTLNNMEIMVDPQGAFSFNALAADDPKWTLDITSNPLVISDVQLALSKDAGAGVKGTLGGTIEFSNSIELTARYDLPGDFYIRAEFPEAKMSDLIARLNEVSIALPEGFDITFEEAWVLIQKQQSDLTFTVAATLQGLGLFAFTAEKKTGWGFAAGVDLDVPDLVKLPGLTALAPFQSFVGLDKMMLLVASIDDPGFQFPSMAEFNAPSITSRNLSLPSQASGVVKGLNIYAQLKTTNSQPFQTLAKYLGIQLDGTVGVTLAVSLPNPTSNSKLFLSVSQEIQPGTKLTGMLGGLLQGGDVGVFLTGEVKTKIQDQPIEFDVTLMVLANGMLISGTMKGSPVRFDPLPVQLSNLALVVGISWEAIPSLGIAGTLDVNNFNSSLAIFFDSVNPSKSMFAGAVSNLTLLDVARTLGGQSSFTDNLDAVLGQIGLKGLGAFQMPATVATALDNRDLASISSAFKQYGATSLPSSSDSILLTINTKGSAWHLTDMSTMRHYSLSLQGSQITVELQPQIYCAPLDTFIGSIKFPQGFHIEAEIDFLMLQARVKIIVSVQQGVAADVGVAPIVIYSHDFFAITDAAGQGGPLLSLATFTQPSLPDPNLRTPHFLLTGKMRILGLDVSSTYVLVNAHGLTFKLTQQISSVLYLDLNGNFDSLSNMSAGGQIKVGINRPLDLGQMGRLNVQTDVNGALNMASKGGSTSATFQGGFEFQSLRGNIPTLNLDVNGQPLANIADIVWQQVSDIISKFLNSADQWLDWVRRNVIQGVAQNAEQVGQVLGNVFHLPDSDIASKTKQVLGYGSTEIARALKGAGVSPDRVVQILQQMQYGAQEIVSVIQSVFANQRININFGHVDTPSGPHTDTPAAPHLDTPPKAHIDIKSTHADYSKWGVHVDTGSPHVDTAGKLHVDTPAYPHIDTVPHVDTGTHIDIKP